MTSLGHCCPGCPGSGGDADVAAVAALFGDPARACMLLALAANHELSASALASEAGLSAPATSAHLRKLTDGGLITVNRRGRYRFYRIAGVDVAAALETLARLAPPRPVRSLRQSVRGKALRFARICYDHLAGHLSVAITDALISRRAITPVVSSGHQAEEELWALGPGAASVLGELGVEFDRVAPRAVDPSALRTCYDWSARRPHLAGSLGASLLVTMLDRRWLARIPKQRAVNLTERGAEALSATLDLVVSPEA
ncbi:helix-turn-helix transcriptional regulator [Solihabitans fulvus]|uniref:Helix-turn-helix transcriptional regulator n=1 Tax=Solihabitans fulvus TaxID=1892852 RepID=A0A5B2XW10_9PSEU|nr:metalloregulator ArsR/SmtB family transcription factor [Solihabitans fulvus]KAA2267039.1 helix-turn-helix transcriptional regulator [Solihabitans fulvus]